MANTIPKETVHSMMKTMEQMANVAGSSKDEWIYSIHRMDKAVEEFGSVSDEPEPHWIPVAERLPDESGWYAITIDRFGERHTRAINLKDDNEIKTLVSGDWWEHGNRYDVIAWMPLPEPYHRP